MKRLLVFCLLLTSCVGGSGSNGSGGGGGGSSSTISSVTVSCSPSTIQVSQTSKCSATVTGTGNFDSSVTWSVDNGTIDANGNYTAPSSPTTATVKATSKQDSTKSGMATTTVNAASTITSVTVSCNPSTVPEGQTSSCTATVQGTGIFDPTVIWTAAKGNVVSTGKNTATYAAPTAATGTDTVTATSTQDTTKSGKTSINVVIQPPSAAFQVSGPGGGDILSLAADPRSPRTMYVSAYASGIYKSSDGGATWQNFGANFPNNQSLEFGLIDQIGVSANSGTVYLGFKASTGVAGRQVYKTADDGKSWTQLASLPASSSNLASQIVLDPLNDNMIYVVDTQNGLYKSTDGGSTWAAVSLPATCGGSLYHDSATDGKLYFGSSCSGFYVSKDFGNTWSLLSNMNNIGVGDIYGGALLVQAPSNPQRIYATGYNAGPLFNLYMSSDGGATWSTLLQGYGLGGLVVYPSNPDQVFLSTWQAFTTSNSYRGLIETLDGGKTWTQLGYPKVTPGYSYTSVGPLLRVSASPDLFIGATAEHLWLIQNTGSLWTWVQSDQGLTANFGIQVAVDPSVATNVYLAAANGSGISKSTDGGRTWRNIFNVYGADSIAVDPFDPNHILAGVSLADPLSISDSPLWVSNDGGTTWQQNPSPSAAGTLNATTILFDPNTKGTIYLGFAWNKAPGIAKSTDGGATWSFVNTGLSNSALIVWSLAIDPFNSQVLIAGTNAGLYKSADGGGTWTLKDSSQIPYSIVFDGNHSGYVYASGSHLVKSTDDGETWSNVSLGRSDLAGILTLAVDPKSADTIFLMPWGGPAVGWSPDGGVTWFWLSSGLGPFLLGGNGSVSIVSKTTPETLYIPSPNVGVVSLSLQH